MKRLSLRSVLIGALAVLYTGVSAQKNQLPKSFKEGDNAPFWAHWDKAEAAGKASKKARHYYEAYKIYAYHSGLLENVIRYGDENLLLTLIPQLEDTLRLVELPRDVEISFKNSLYFAEYRLGEYTRAYDRAKALEPLIRHHHDLREKSRWVNNIAVMHLLHAGYKEAYFGSALPVHCTDYRLVRGKFEASRCLAPEEAVAAENERKFQKAGIWPFQTWCADMDSVSNKAQESELDKTAKRRGEYCGTHAFPFNYELLYNKLNEYDEILLLHDLSASMDTITYNTMGITRNQLANNLLACLTYDLNHKRLGIASVEGTCSDTTRIEAIMNTYDTAFYQTIKDTLQPYGYTPIIDRLDRIDELFPIHGKRKRAVFMITDGVEVCEDPLDLCQLSRDLFYKGYDLGLLHMLTNDPVYRPFFWIYDCITSVSRFPIYQLGETGNIETMPRPAMGIPYFKIDSVIMVDELSAKQLVMSRGSSEIALVYPSNEFWLQGHKLGAIKEPDVWSKLKTEDWKLLDELLQDPDYDPQFNDKLTDYERQLWRLEESLTLKKRRARMRVEQCD